MEEELMIQNWESPEKYLNYTDNPLPPLPNRDYQDMSLNLDASLDYIPNLAPVSQYEASFATSLSSPPMSSPEDNLIHFGSSMLVGQYTQALTVNPFELQDSFYPNNSPELQQEYFPIEPQLSPRRVQQLAQESNGLKRATSSNSSLSSGYSSNGSLMQATPDGYQCLFPGCEKVFQKQTNLKSHLKIHNSERNYPCPDCGTSFRRSHDLKRHQRSIHSEIKPFSCPQCHKGFSRMDALRRHTSRDSSPCYRPME